MTDPLQGLARSDTMPVLFLGHGSPMNVVLDNDFTRSLAALGPTLPRPEAIMVISAHWLTDGTFVTCTDRPETLHDFYGFPQSLYAIRYPSPGAPLYARAVAELVRHAPVLCEDNWGLDHAAWAVLRHLYPQADIPVLELSLDMTRPPKHHYALAAELAPLREHGLLIVGSGNLVHNLELLNLRDTHASPYPWAVEFDAWVKERLLSPQRHEAQMELVDYQRRGHLATLAVPTSDHYLPLLYALALQRPDEPLTFVYEGFQNSSISMRCLRIG